MSVELSIVIPCYNEGGNIHLIISRLQEIIAANVNIEVVLVENGSTDNSKEVFKRELTKVNPEIFKLNIVPKNMGYGYGVLSGLEAASGRVLAWTHADMQTDPADVLEALKVYNQCNDPYTFVKGKRKNRNWLEVVFTFGMQVIANIALKVKLDDINAQPKLFSREFFVRFIQSKAPHDFSLDLYALCMAKKHCNYILEIPVMFNKRMHGEAKGGGSWKTRIKLIKRTLKYIFELRDYLKSIPQ